MPSKPNEYGEHSSARIIVNITKKKKKDAVIKMTEESHKHAPYPVWRPGLIAHDIFMGDGLSLLLFVSLVFIHII